MLCDIPFYFPIDKMVRGFRQVVASDPSPVIDQLTGPDGPQQALSIEVLMHMRRSQLYEVFKHCFCVLQVTNVQVSDLVKPGDGLKRTFHFRVFGK